MDLIKAFRKLKISEKPGLEEPESAQKQANKDKLLRDIPALWQQQQTEIDGLRGLINEMTGAVERLERRLNESRMRVETQVQRTYYQVGEMLRDRPVTLWKSTRSRCEQPSLLLVLRSYCVSSEPAYEREIRHSFSTPDISEILPRT